MWSKNRQLLNFSLSLSSFIRRNLIQEERSAFPKRFSTIRWRREEKEKEEEEKEEKR